jgi:hypothetical protein
MMSTTVPRSVTVEAYARFRTEGVLAPGEVAELIAHAEALPPVERQRIHMLHRRLEIHERYLLHPRILDVVEGLVGPDVLALQTMLFLKPPGAPGQGYHQDSFHIITKPDTLIGAWIALDRADEENGCLLVTAGSQAEPIYPDADESKGHGGDHRLEGIGAVAHADDPDESVNELTRVAARYRGREVAAGLEPGDAVFFGGHLLHRSHANRSATRSRRAFVAHYCDARSLVPWDDEPLGDGEAGNAPAHPRPRRLPSAVREVALGSRSGDGHLGPGVADRRVQRLAPALRPHDRHRDPEPLDLRRQVAPEPVRDALGQRGDDHLVEVLVHEHALDGEHRVGGADDRRHLVAGRLLEQGEGELDRLAGLLVAERLLGDQLRHEQRERARAAVGALADGRDQRGGGSRAVGDDQDACGVHLDPDRPTPARREQRRILRGMDDAQIQARIEALEQDEHRLRKDEEAQAEAGRTEAVGVDAGRLAAIKVELDQLWDLLRQRRALRAAGRDPDEARMRDSDTVERYLG